MASHGPNTITTIASHSLSRSRSLHYSQQILKNTLNTAYFPVSNFSVGTGETCPIWLATAQQKEPGCSLLEKWAVPVLPDDPNGRLFSVN
ncbi:hypothetical protein VHEMI04447 [[Torrubiella] hemipterigena]|uniref:Uncharacterized protein n=1 Tax=[Torrubiella] hemipterigena TaxID=1531966 RepID=A0A0A1TEA5_9HYPO|nr:hypothetical protein VHEMI04447 [[Torrubiella] hemipterigena]